MRWRETTTNYTQKLPTPGGKGEGFGFISQRDKNRRRFRRGDMAQRWQQTAADDRVFRRTYNLRSPINIPPPPPPPPGQGRVLSRRSLGSTVPAPIALHLGTRAYGWQTYWFCDDYALVSRRRQPADCPLLPNSTGSTRSLPVARRLLGYCCKNEKKKTALLQYTHIQIYTNPGIIRTWRDVPFPP